VYAGKAVKGAKVTATQIKFQVPKDATTGLIALRAGKARDLSVGTFEVVPKYDPEAERKKAEEEARKKAEAAVAARQKQLAKERAEREAALQKRYEELSATREQRRAARAAEIRARWALAFLADPDTQDELALHAQRIAELERMRDLAELTADSKLALRVEMLRTREDERHQQRMTALEAAFRAGGNQ
jgi:hypothetical protein